MSIAVYNRHLDNVYQRVSIEEELKKNPENKGLRKLYDDAVAIEKSSNELYQRFVSGDFFKFKSLTSKSR